MVVWKKHFQQLGHIAGRQGCHGYMNLQSGVQDVADLVAAAAVHQVTGLRNDEVLAAAIFITQHMSDLQCPAAVTRVQHDDLTIF